MSCIKESSPMESDARKRQLGIFGLDKSYVFGYSAACNAPLDIPHALKSSHPLGDGRRHSRAEVDQVPAGSQRFPQPPRSPVIRVPFVGLRSYRILHGSPLRHCKRIARLPA